VSGRAKAKTAGTINGSSGDNGASGNGNQIPSFGKGLWEGGWTGSWTTLQGLASSVLGGDAEGNSGISKTGKSSGKEAVRRRKQDGLATAPALTEWGPTGLSNKGKDKDATGAAMFAARNSAVDALKTASLLESHEGINGGLSVSNHKRRMSDDLADMGNADDEGDALVYVHHVKPTDTLAGVILKYNCDPAVFRKANRLWPNDAIQVREVVLVPVDACAVRGKPCDPPTEGQSVDLLAPTSNDEEPPNLAISEESPWANSILSPFTSHERNPNNPDEGASPWAHVRWVLLLSSSPSAQPTEIARLPRKTLGYFPPRRRKSQGTLSPFASPRVSIDFSSSPAASPGPAVRGTPARRLSNLSSSVRSSYFPEPPMSAAPSRGTSVTRSRRDSASETGRAAWLRGPGGVGTLAANVRKPGPAQDGLNSWAAKHVPSFTIGDLPSTAAVGKEDAISFGFRDELGRIEEGALGGGVATPGGGGGEGGGGIDVGAAAAAIEGWIRRLRTKPSTPKLGSRGRPVEEMGDLIELLDGTGSDDGRGFEPTPSAAASRSAVSSAGSGRNGATGARGGKGGKTD